MIRAISLVRKPAVKPERVADTVWLDHEARQGGQAAVRSHGGLEFRLELDRAAVLNDGDAVKLEDGRLVQVRAAPQPLIEVRAENPLRLMRFAWHIGQRHAPAELKADVLYLRDEPALAEMARGQGCSVTHVMRPFHPEHVDEHACEHHGHHEHGHHGHDHPPDHGHAHAPSHDHDHASHGHGSCGHDHGHKHEH